MPKLLPWEQLQEDVRLILESVDARAKVSRGSGAVKGNGDVQSPNYMAECKLRSTPGFTIQHSVMEKIIQEATLLGKIPLVVNRNAKGKTLVTMTLEDFAKIAALPKEINGQDRTSSSFMLH